MYRKTFDELTKNELYAILKLRQDVFVIEQNSIYSDLDNQDQYATHFLEHDGNQQLILYARYRLEKVHQEVKIERVVLAKEARGKGQGKRLIETMLQDIKIIFPTNIITLSSQLEVCPFYRTFGFVEEGEPYDDGGIAHLHMVLK